jgi:ATP-dependent DNA helicase PIF1
LEIVDLIFQDLIGVQTPFGGKVVVLGGDFRQVLPVIRKGSRCAIIASTIRKSSIWPLFQTFKLKRNMRAITDPDFSKWLLDIGDGIIPLPSTPKTQFSVEVPISLVSNDIVSDIFGNSFTCNDVENFSRRSILCPKNEDVRLINERVLMNLKNVEQMSFYAIDSVKHDDGVEDYDLQVNIPVEYLNTLNPSGLAPYKLNLKVGCIVMLLRNVSVNKGLCNGTRMIVRAFRQNVLQLEIISGAFSGTVHFIPRISLDTSNDPALPFNFVRHQFPVRLAYAMTVNKSQGQTFDKIGLYLPEPCFSHGQFYTGCSRAMENNGLKIQVKDTIRQGKINNGQTVTDNVVYREILS